MESTMKIKCTPADIRAAFVNDVIDIRYYAPANEDNTIFRVIVRHPETANGKELKCRTLEGLIKKVQNLYNK